MTEARGGARRWMLGLVALCALFGQQAAWAQGQDLLGAGERPTLRCVITQCAAAEDCRAPFSLGDFQLSADVGSDFLFQIVDPWEVTPGHFRLEDRRYAGDSYLTRTTLNMEIDRRTKALGLSIAFAGSGGITRKVTATGHCEAVDTVPVVF